MTDLWNPGESLILRYGRSGQTRSVLAGVVVEDVGEAVTVWVPPRSPVLRLAVPGGPFLHEMSRREALEMHVCRAAVMRPSQWSGPGIVMHFPLDKPWSVWWFFNVDGSFNGWYGNLEAPKVRWERQDGSRGLDSADRELDVDIGADGTWRWKDEEAFGEKTGLDGYWTAEQELQIRADGERLIELLERRLPPFDGRYTDFAPDPARGLPTLPENWDHPHLVTGA